MTVDRLLLAAGLLLAVPACVYLARRLLAQRRQARYVTDTVRRLLNRPERVQAVAAAERVVLPPDHVLDDLCVQAARVTGAPSAYVSVVRGDRQVVKASHGLDGHPALAAAGVGLRSSVCMYVAAHDAPLAARDVHEHPLLRACVTDVVAYLGVPVHLHGQPVGALAVCDRRPRDWTDEQQHQLQQLARRLERELADRSR